MIPADERSLRRSIDLAGQAGARGNRPFGSVIAAADGTVLGEGENEADTSGDLTAHAEVVALRRVAPTDLVGATVYASGEPCPMCTAALVWAGVARIVFAASTQAFAPILPGGPQFDIGCAELVGRCDADIEVAGPALEHAALAVMRAAQR